MAYYRPTPHHPKQVDLIASTDDIFAKLRRQKKLLLQQLEPLTTPPHQLDDSSLS